VQVINLLNTLSGDPVEMKIAVHHGDLVKLLGINDIVYVESEGRYCHITSNTKERLTTAKLIKEFEDFLGNSSPVIRIHKSCMINVNHIKEYSNGEPCIITMIDGATFEVARRKKQEILERIKK
jgi:two-component system LytT family response regulator